jgi:hypothetical protein
VRIGVLAYGSLRTDPGGELLPLIVERVTVRTPFGIEYGRFSQTRGGAPTVVPHPRGAPVDAEVLVLDGSVGLDAAQDMVWRREVRQVGTSARPSPRSPVVVRALEDFAGCTVVLYTDFIDDPIEEPNPTALAKAALQSVGQVSELKDGLAYLADLLGLGVITPLTFAYRDEILRLSGARTLDEARTRGAR